MTTVQIANELKEIKALLQEQQPRPLTLEEAAEYLNLSRSRLYTLTSRSEIPFYKPTGKKVYFQKSDLDQFLLRNRSESRQNLQANGKK